MNTTKRMPAWLAPTFGAPADVLRREDVIVPVPGDDEVLVEVAYTGLNFADVLCCRGTIQVLPPLPFTPGREVAGRVAATGPGANWRTGERVAGIPALRHGGLARFCIVHRTNLFWIPPGLGDQPAACLTVNYHTAYLALFRRARVQKGDTVLVHAGAGGLGSAAIQLANSAGARVLATAGSAAKVAACRRLGAEAAIDYTSADFVDFVRAHTSGHGADIVVDPVGGDACLRSFDCMSSEGRIVLLGFASGSIPRIRATAALMRNVSILGVNREVYRSTHPELMNEAHAAVLDAQARRFVQPLIDRVGAFTAAPDALRDLEERRITGKVLIEAP
jgi:NADPH2:quinone reductase